MSELVNASEDHGRLMLVTWVDSGRATIGWSTTEEAMKESVVLVTTVGYFIGENERVIILGQSTSEDGDFCNTQIILQTCVTKKEFLS